MKQWFLLKVLFLGLTASSRAGCHDDRRPVRAWLWSLVARACSAILRTQDRRLRPRDGMAPSNVLWLRWEWDEQTMLWTGHWRARERGQWRHGQLVFNVDGTLIGWSRESRSEAVIEAARWAWRRS